MNIPYANTGHMKDEEITIPEILKKERFTGQQLLESKI
jgi:hypothetical protein